MLSYTLLLSDRDSTLDDGDAAFMAVHSSMDISCRHSSWSNLSYDGRLGLFIIVICACGPIDKCAQILHNIASE